MEGYGLLHGTFGGQSTEEKYVIVREAQQCVCPGPLAAEDLEEP